MADAQQSSVPAVAEKDDKREDSTSPTGASRTKEQTPPRPRSTTTFTDVLWESTSFHHVSVALTLWHPEAIIVSHIR